jgi:hypothetical protein
VWLGDGTRKVASLFLDNFDSAAQSVLQWLRGDDVSAIHAAAGNHLVKVLGEPAR